MTRRLVWLMALTPMMWGQIAGKAVGEQKRGLAQVWVMWHRMPDVRVAGETTSSGGMATGANGAFQFTGLRDGTYVLCATAPLRLGYLSTCAWNPMPPRLVVKGGMAVAAQEIQMEKGAKVELRFEDKEGLLPKPGQAGAKWFVAQMRPAGGGLPVGARPLEKRNGEMVYVLLTPAKARGRVEVEGEDLEFEDVQTGARTAAVGKDLPELATAAATHEMRFRVKGKGQP